MPSIESLKRRAKELKRKSRCTHSEALDEVARQQGYANWSLLAKTRLIAPGVALERDTLEQIIKLADRSRAAGSAMIKKHDDGDGGTSNLGSKAHLALGIDWLQSDERLKLVREIAALRDIERAELIALMWLGRGDGGESAADWSDLVAEALPMSEKWEEGTSYLVLKGPLASYLRDGLAVLKGSGRQTVSNDPVPAQSITASAVLKASDVYEIIALANNYRRLTQQIYRKHDVGEVFGLGDDNVRAAHAEIEALSDRTALNRLVAALSGQERARASRPNVAGPRRKRRGSEGLAGIGQVCPSHEGRPRLCVR